MTADRAKTEGETQGGNYREISGSSPPPPVSVPASKCDRPGQADAAVAEAVAWQWNAGHQGWITAASRDEALLRDAQYRCLGVRPLYATPEAALRATAPEELEGWRAIETAPRTGLCVLLRRGLGYDPVVAHWHDGSPGYVGWVMAHDRSPCVRRYEWHYLPAPPTAAPAPPVDHAEGQGEEEPTAHINVIGDQGISYIRFAICPKNMPVQRYRMSIGGSENLRDELIAILASANPAPAPGCEDGAIFERLDLMDQRQADLLVAIHDRLLTREIRQRLARTPARTDGGVSDAEVEAALRVWCDNTALGTVRATLRAALEAAAAARAAETAGGAGEMDETRNDCPRCSNIDALGQCEHPMPNDGQPPCIRMLEAARTTPNRAGEKQ